MDNVAWDRYILASRFGHAQQLSLALALSWYWCHCHALKHDGIFYSPGIEVKNLVVLAG